ncbi:MAG: glycosyltransferase family 2 protein [Alphaproteobacteria bacterium]
MNTRPKVSPRVSIITICFNQAPFLERAIRSVIDQDYPEIEYIVVDPGSTDGSRDIIERYRDRIDKIVLDPDDGPPDGLNKGFAVASGEILGYLNADDAFLPDTLGAAVDALGAHPNWDVVTGNGYMVDRAGRVTREFRSTRFSLWSQAYGAVVIMQQATFFRRAAFAATDGFNPDNRTSWDIELLIDMALAGKRIGRAKGHWGVFRIHDDSITGSQTLAATSRQNWDRMFEKIMGRPRRLADKPLRLLARLVKWVRHPDIFVIALRDRYFGPPDLGCLGEIEGNDAPKG